MIHRVTFELESIAIENEGRPTHLMMWLHADSEESARQKASRIVAELPYLLSDAEPSVLACLVELRDDSKMSDFDARVRAHERIAGQVGLSLMLCVHRPKAQEELSD
jgi:hypothetical protein